MDLNLTEYIRNPERLNADSLDKLHSLVERYPYFQALRLLYVRNLYQMHDARFGEELRRAALFVPDRRALFQLIEGHQYLLQPVKKHQSLGAREQGGEEMPDRTHSLIENFLSGVPEEKTKRVRADATTDYMTFLMQSEDSPVREEDSPRMNHQNLIDDFIGQGDKRIVLSTKEPEGAQMPSGLDNNEENEENEDYFTETLAKIYIKQGRYAKAIEIIRKLSLKYPKKNRYFADQIRFLEKLIINNKNK